MSAEPLAWLVSSNGSTVFISAQWLQVEAYTKDHSYTVTPLVAAPPEDGRPTCVDLREIAEGWLANAERLYEESFRYGSDGAMSRSYADAQRLCANTLLSRIPKEEP